MTPERLAELRELARNSSTDDCLLCDAISESLTEIENLQEELAEWRSLALWHEASPESKAGILQAFSKIRAEERERCAKIADSYNIVYEDSAFEDDSLIDITYAKAEMAEDIARGIRSLKDDPKE